jgi:hypothetical protein
MLTKSDWAEIYYALEYKRYYHPSVTVDEEWCDQLDNIILKIGPDGEDAYNEYQGVKG